MAKKKHQIQTGDMRPNSKVATAKEWKHDQRKKRRALGFDYKDGPEGVEIGDHKRDSPKRVDSIPGPLKKLLRKK